jgi:monoamine oxidase
VDADIIVVGAGASGLAAAARIRAAGKRPLVLEARDRLGGRIDTDREFAGFALECGAELIHGRRSRSRQLVRLAGLRCAPALGLWYGRVAEGGQLRRIIPWLLGCGWGVVGLTRELKRDRAGDESLAAVLDRREASRHLRRLLSTLANSAGATPGHLSARDLGRFLTRNEETGGDWRLLDGYDSVPAHLAVGIALLRNEVVTSVDWSSSRAVRVDASRSYWARAVIVTVPLGVLKAGRLRFQPALPRPAQDAVAGLEMSGGMKVILRFSALQWPRQMSFLVLDEAVPVVWPPRPGAPVLTAFVMGQRADALRAPPGAVERVLRALDPVLGLAARRSLVDALVIDWGADPFTMGGYSSVPPGSFGLRAQLADHAGSLLFAGEATDELAPGTVSGAIRAGERAAEQALRLIDARQS